jgi:hypothetical protein
MAKKKDSPVDEAAKIKAEIDALKEKAKILDAKPSKSKKTPKKTEAKPTKKATKTEKQPSKKMSKKETPTEKKSAKKEEKPTKPKKLSKKELEEIKREEEKTLEEELEEQLTDTEIENFQIEKVDMEKLTARVCDILAEKESEGMFQSELWKKLKLSSRDGSRLALKLERMGTIYREKILEKGRWTYKLILKKTPISTLSIENAPCLVCPVEQKCSMESEISPQTCKLIEDWVLADVKKSSKTK